MRAGRTHGGGGAKSFCWGWDGATVQIWRENGWDDRFPVAEVAEIVNSLEDQFRLQWFPLANNVEKMRNGTEQPGLGMTILNIRPGDVRHAQASSYLGVVFEHVGLATWNGKSRRIAWRLNRQAPTVGELGVRLSEGGRL